MEPSSKRLLLLLLLESLLLWFEIVLDWEDFILLIVKGTVKNRSKIISALQRLSFVFTRLVRCKILVPTTQALQCLMPNAVLDVHIPFIEWGEKRLPGKSSVLCGSCPVWVRRHGNGNKPGIPPQLSIV